MKLSVTIITYNEEDRLEEALKSVRDIADEIVVVDSYSTDNTTQIAAKYNARILFNAFDNYGSQKNYALDKAQHEWVLNLDADERVSPELSENIHHLKKLDDIEADGFLIKRKTSYLGRWIMHSGWYPDRKLRLFKKSKSHWSGRIHERLVLDGRLQNIEGEILHYTYRDMNDHVQRINRYSYMQAQDIVTKNKKALYLRAMILPSITFIRFYFWKLGILDGFPGFVIALVSSWGTAMKYLKAIALKRKAG